MMELDKLALAVVLVVIIMFTYYSSQQHFTVVAEEKITMPNIKYHSHVDHNMHDPNDDITRSTGYKPTNYPSHFKGAPRGLFHPLKSL